jgi:3-methylcrotonyl-CoA carboxylase alpha subunit
MISKLIVWGEDRNIAVQKMRKAIAEYKIGGLVTNLPFLKRVIDHPEFAEFDYDLQFIDQYQDILIPEKMIVGENQLISSIFLFANYNNVESSQGLPNDFTNFRLNHSATKSFNIDINYAHSTNDAYITVSTPSSIFENF